MRDYKNVKVPRKYRTGSDRPTVKRVDTGHISRRQKPGSGGIKRMALTALLVAVIAAGCCLGWLAYRTIMHAEMFQIAGVDVKGVKHLDETELKKIVGAFTKENIFRADLDAAVRRAQGNPWVKSVSVNRRLPNRISMTIAERVPAALLETAMGRYLLDDEGVVISLLAREKTQEWHLPVIAIRDYMARPGAQVTTDGMGEALKLLAEITARSGWRLEAMTIKAGSPEEISIVYADHEFKLGSGRYPEKLRRLGEVMEDVKRRDLYIAYVDLRPDRQVAVMVKNRGKIQKQQQRAVR
jgi:cell division protein FtsQ